MVVGVPNRITWLPGSARIRAWIIRTPRVRISITGMAGARLNRVSG